MKITQNTTRKKGTGLPGLGGRQTCWGGEPSTKKIKSPYTGDPALIPNPIKGSGGTKQGEKTWARPSKGKPTGGVTDQRTAIIPSRQETRRRTRSKRRGKGEVKLCTGGTEVQSDRKIWRREGGKVNKCGTARRNSDRRWGGALGSHGRRCSKNQTTRGERFNLCGLGEKNRGSMPEIPPGGRDNMTKVEKKTKRGQKNTAR